MTILRMPQLSKGVYKALRRTLDNVWFGNPMPLQEACEYVQREQGDPVSESVTREHLAEYINLLVHVLFPENPPEQIKETMKRYEHLILSAITEGQAQLEPLRKREQELYAVLSPIQQEVWELDRQVTKLRERKKEHERGRARYEERVKELEQAEAQLQRDLARIDALSPITIEDCLAQIIALTQQSV